LLLAVVAVQKIVRTAVAVQVVVQTEQRLLQGERSANEN
jgi:hypothetical protein